MTYRGTASWKYKLSPIDEITKMSSRAEIFDQIDLKNVFIVPIPPSKVDDMF